MPSKSLRLLKSLAQNPKSNLIFRNSLFLRQFIPGIYVETAYIPSMFKRIFQAPSLAIYVIFVPFLHTREFYHINHVDVEPVIRRNN